MKSFKQLREAANQPHPSLDPTRAYLHGAESHKEGEDRQVHPDYDHDSLRDHWYKGWDDMHGQEKIKRIKGYTKEDRDIIEHN